MPTGGGAAGATGGRTFATGGATAQAGASVGGSAGKGAAPDAGAAGGEDIPPLPAVACEAAVEGGSENVAAPVLVASLSNRWHEAWLGSPAIADLDGDGTNEIVMLGSVQNAAQSDRERGVALFVVNHDGTRPHAWVTPFHAPEFIDGLWDPGDNVVASTNQLTVADIDAESPRFEFVFAGFDGQIHAVSSDNRELWVRRFTERTGVFTGGVLVADLSGDGRPEIIFNTYSVDADQGELFILAANGVVLHRIALPDRGAMPVPTAHDIDGDGQLEIVVSLKDGVDRERQVLVYSVPGSRENCLLWPTGRGNLLRTGAPEP
jgi:hypothetical protein